jgi:hypothetical protein
MDKHWEDLDIANDVDVCLVTGIPGPRDKGRNEILLAGRIYHQGFEIPYCWTSIADKFLNKCFDHLPKCGFETRRLGGSGGDSEATKEQIDYFREHRGCFPNIAGAVVHLPISFGRWRAYYVSPYVNNTEQSISVSPYSTPKRGGALRYNAEISMAYPLLFDRMSKVRFTMVSILESINQKYGISISPVACQNQKKYNTAAECLVKNKQALRVINVLNRQVVYSFVAYTVGIHKDVTKNGVAKELIECKGLIQWPSRSFQRSKNSSSIALGRGGAGPGVFTVMIVDHPEK